MLSMIILNKLSYPTMLKKQSEHQRFTLPDPLVNCAHLKNTQTSSLLVTVKKRAVGKLLT